jgi:RNA methyltransferase, TrmH family
MARIESERIRHVTSRQNALVKDLRRAFHNGELLDGFCAIEGTRVIDEAIRSGLRIRTVFFAESAGDRANKLLPQISSHTEVIALPDDVFSSAVSTESPQGVAALVKWPEFSLDRVFDRPDPLLLGAIGIQDPGNLGTIVRSAEAFGAAAVIVGEKTVSATNAKVIRASAGSVFRLPTVRLSAGELESLKKKPLRVLATSSHKGRPIDEVDLGGALAVMVGSEGAGVPREYLALADEFIRVPHTEKVESLNAAVAASVVLYEAQRQRNSQHRGTETQRHL